MRSYYVPVFSLLFFLLIVSGCKKTSPTPPPPPATSVDLAAVKISNFRFSEVNYTSLSINHPVLVNGKETVPGLITIKIPRGNTGLQLTPFTANFQMEGFTISPQLGVLTDYLFKEVLYTITSVSDPQQKVNYRVTVQEEPAPGPLGITGFRFLKSMNAQLSEDVAAVQIMEGNGSIGKIHVLVPEGTHFGALTAVIDHNGDEIRYTQSSFEVPANSPNVYPHTGLSIDYAYPKGFYAAVKRGNEVKTYSVIVDVQKPIGFINDHVIISGLQSGATQTIKVGELVNRGNRPITITQLLHTDELPQGTDLRTFVTIPSGGLLPGAKIDIKTTLTEGFFFPGTYQVKAAIRPSFFQEEEMQPFLLPSVFHLKVELQ